MKPYKEAISFLAEAISLGTKLGKFGRVPNGKVPNRNVNGPPVCVFKNLNCS